MIWPTWLPPLLNIVISVVGVFLILLVLIQRGKGGGLAGAFGGVGGSSAFGSRAGDQFTKVTLITALVWVLLIMFMTKIVPQAATGQQVAPDRGGEAAKAPAAPTPAESTQP